MDEVITLFGKPVLCRWCRGVLWLIVEDRFGCHIATINPGARNDSLTYIKATYTNAYPIDEQTIIPMVYSALQHGPIRKLINDYEFIELFDSVNSDCNRFPVMDFIEKLENIQQVKDLCRFVLANLTIIQTLTDPQLHSLLEDQFNTI